MSLSIGIVGLPNVGKSTLFNALTSAKVEAQNYPFCTIDPNIGIVAVPDPRLSALATVIPTQKIVPAVVEFIDIAGIVEGASTGEGLGNKFLANIRECDAIAEVVRVFTDTDVLHVSGKINPISDIETIKMELILADIETVEKRLAKLIKEAKTNPKLKDTLATIEKVKDSLDKGTPVRELALSEKENQHLKDLNLLSAKPHIYVYNCDESHLTSHSLSSLVTNPGISSGPIEGDPRFRKDDSVAKLLTNENTVLISAKIEAELNDLSSADKQEYLAEIGQTESGLETLVKKGFELLGLQTYFTAGEKEIKAWTIQKGSTAPQAAGVIHGDFERGFIKAEVVNYKDLIEYKGWAGAKAAGKVRLEGKDYICADGDVMVFKFAV